jgi:alkylation response protein AidB-like acyl-CoA dehydrogenase
MAETRSAAAMIEGAHGLARELAETYQLRDKLGDFPHEEMAKLKRSGLLAATVPAEHGGAWLPFADFTEIVMILAAANPSIAHNYIEHGVFTREILMGTPNPALQKRIYDAIIKDHASVSNAAAERGSPTVLKYSTRFADDPARSGVSINGKKFFCTGAACSDWLFVTGLYQDGYAFAWVPTRAAGVHVLDDWDCMGMRGTGSGSTEFKDALIPRDWMVPIGKLDEKGPDPNSLFAPLFQNSFNAIYVGAAEGMLAFAVEYLKAKSRPYGASGVAKAADDPYVLLDVGRMRAHLSAARAKVREASAATDRALAARGAAGADEMARLRLDAMVQVAEAKVVATDAALQVANDGFKICGARATLTGEGLDKFMRDIRTLTLHDPVDYKARLVGEYVVTGNFYSYLPFYT